MKLLTPSPYERRLVILLTGEFKDKWVSLKGAGEFYQPPGASQENLNERKATQPGLSKEFLSGIFGAQRPMPSQMPCKI
jgi:hypothetical protein